MMNEKIKLPEKKKSGGLNRMCFADKVFHVINWTALILFMIIELYPMIYVLISSFNGSSHMLPLNLIPKETSLEGYKAVFEYRWIWSGYLNSLIQTVLGTIISLFVMICCAYPLSKRDFRGRYVLLFIAMVPMYFSGGMIPGYLNLQSLNMLDTIWCIILPGAMNTYNTLVIRSYFENSIPGDLEEAATIDGCGTIKYLVSIALPLSMPIIAVQALMTAVTMWNSYFSPMLYLTTRTKFPLAVILQEILVNNSLDTTVGVVDPVALQIANKRRETMKYSVILVSSIPMLIAYPFVQKYFVKGMMIGAVKG